MGVFETSTSSVWIFPPEKPKKVESALLSNKLQKKKKNSEVVLYKFKLIYKLIIYYINYIYILNTFLK